MSNKTFLIIFIALLFSQFSYGQITDAEKKLKEKNADTTQGWKTGGVFALNLSQTSLTNWAAGGQPSLSLNGLLSTFANYKKGKTVLDNSLDLGYGILRQGKKSDFMKTDDKIDFLSKYGREAFTNFYYAALVNFKTQIRPGYNYPNDSVIISNLLSPAYLLGAIGMDYKPNNYFSLFLSPFTAKVTYVNDKTLADAGAFGVDPATYDNLGNILIHGKKTKKEFGGYLRVIYSRNDFKEELLKNIALTTKMDLFSNYLKNPQNIDVSWETQIAFKVNKFISVNINTHLLYDDDIDIQIDNNDDGIIDATGPRIQFKEILGIGFAYKF